MKLTIIILLLALLSCVGLAQTSTSLTTNEFNGINASISFGGASTYYITNRVSVSQAVKIASKLYIGMTEADADSFLESHGISGRIVDTNGTTIIYSQSVGDEFEWCTFYPLADGCSLGLDMRPSHVNTNWGGNGLLEGASIQSNSFNIISITLTNAP